MNGTSDEAASTAAATLIGLGLLNRMGKLGVRRRSRHRDHEPRAAAPRPRITIVSSLLNAVVYAVLLIAYLVVEVLAAMLAYMYLNLHHIETFGRLIGICRGLLNLFADQLEKFSPTLANQAYATILGELGAKSVLLLFIGLAVSTLVRFVIWFFHKGVETVRTKPAP
ncbi:MAG: hypothetical protein WBP94_13220 [Rhodomicrobiaceae bacterium]